MSIEQIIRKNKRLSELPFLTVYCVMTILAEMGLLRNVDLLEPEPKRQAGGRLHNQSNHKGSGQRMA